MLKAHQSNGKARPLRCAATVLLYHRVAPPNAPDPNGLVVSSASFAAQMAWLADHGYTTVSPSEWFQDLQKGASDRRQVLLTFDDAYADIATHALPVLRRHGFSALIFVVTGRIGGNNDWDDSSLPLMTADEIRHWSQLGFDFASHSHTHPDLRTLASDVLSDELAHSSNILQALCNNPSRAFAYPYGYTNDAVVAAVRKQFQFAFTTAEGLNDAETHVHLLRRTMVLPKDSLLEFSLRVKHGRNPLTAVRSFLSRLKKIFVFGER